MATSNYANLSAVTNGTSIAVMAVLDNLNKGAAGGGVQWMNRLLGFDETHRAHRSGARLDLKRCP